MYSFTKCTLTLLCFFGFIYFAESKIYINNIFINGTASVFPTAPIKVDGNSLTFPNVTGVLARLNATKEERKGKIIPFNNRFWEEDISKVMVEIMKDEPLAIVAFGGAIHKRRHNFGDMQIKLYSTSTKSVTVPVLQLYQEDWSTLRDKYLQYYNEVIITITDLDESEFRPFINGGFIIFWLITVNLFCLVNVVIAAYILIRNGIKANIATVILSIEILANILRILFCLDPYGPIEIFGWDFTTKIYTASLPIDLASTVLLAFYWHELVTNTSMETSGFVTKFRIPAFLIITFFILFEIITEGFRGTPSGDDYYLTEINSYLYFIFILILIIYYIVVSVKVFRYINTLKHMRRSQNLLYQVTIRACISIVGMTGLLIGGILIGASVNNASVYNEYGVNYLIMQSLNLISIAHIAAFKVKPSGASSTSNRSQQDSEKETENSLTLSSKGDDGKISRKANYDEESGTVKAAKAEADDKDSEEDEEEGEESEEGETDNDEEDEEGDEDEAEATSSKEDGEESEEGETDDDKEEGNDNEAEGSSSKEGSKESTGGSDEESGETES